MTNISVIVCTRNRPDLIGDCLSALEKNQADGLEILVIDQSIDDATEEIVSSAAGIDRRIRYIRTDTVGLSRARNIGIAQSSGKIVAFTDDDCLPAQNWAESIVRQFENMPEISAAYGSSLPWPKVLPGEKPVAVKADKKKRIFKGLHNPWDVGHGCNMAFRKEVFNVVGLFDEALGPGGILKNGDDSDFTYRLLRSGLTALYTPEALVHHQQFRHGNDLWKLEKDYGIGAGALYSKHLRCGDLYMLKLILDRWGRAGAAYLVYGILTGRSRYTKLGWYRIAYSLLGLWMARNVKISGMHRTYVECL